jgi:hypothetical protein
MCGDRRNWVATIGKTVLEPVQLLQSGIHWILGSGLYRRAVFSDKVKTKRAQKDFSAPKKQNVPVETGTQLSTGASVSHYYVLSSKF